LFILLKSTTAIFISLFNLKIRCCMNPINNYNYVIRFECDICRHQPSPRPLRACAEARKVLKKLDSLRQLLEVRPEGDQVQEYAAECEEQCSSGRHDGLHDRWTVRVRPGMLFGSSDEEAHGHPHLNFDQWLFLRLPPRLRICN
jgi:hypothetical protein